MRDLPTQIQTAKADAAQRTFWLIDVHLKAGSGYAAEDFRFSSQAVNYGGHFYEPRLKSKPQIRHTLGAATDGGTVKIDNTDLGIGQKFLPKDRFIEGSPVSIFFAFQLPDGSIYADKVFEGEISGATLSMSDNAVNLSLIGDLYKPNAVMGAFPLAQRCVLEFNAGGILSPDVSPCGWQTTQGGNPLFCDKTEDGADGCSAHNNLHRIGAIPFFANAVVQIVNTSGTGGGGSSGFPGTQECFINESRVLLPNFSEMPIVEFQAGFPVISFNERTGKLEADEVVAIHVHKAKRRRILTIEFADGGRVGVTPEHPAYVNFGEFKAVGELSEDSFIYGIEGISIDNYRWKAGEIVSVTESFETVEVRNLSVKNNKTFIVERRGWHNVKPAYQTNI